MIDRISIRMYHVGFGDCFLLRFWAGGKDARILIDCGSITEGEAQVSRVAEDVIAACRDPDGVARIALVAATHRHRDHVGGFSNPKWAEVEVGEVWMPWTEDPDDPEATYIRNRQSSLAASLAPESTDQDPLAAAPARESAKAALKRSLDAMALNALTNEKAMATLHGGFAKTVKPAFLPPKDTPFEARTVQGAEGVTAHVLGPPRDKTAVAMMDPPAGKGYLAADEALNDGGGAFGPHWRIEQAAFRKAAPDTTLRAGDIKALDSNAEQPTGELAAALDNAVNNTSLILLFEVEGQHLLFPADAQWGSWNAALQDPGARALLARTNFYKVGHHGSHNATPKELIESLIAPGFTAMFSTCHVTQWPDIPRAPLVQAIQAKSARYARSDDEDAARAAGFTVEPGLYVEWEIPLAGGGAAPPAAGVRLRRPRRKPGGAVT